jgi:aerobic-type carbon monoxide dehydrogenase small subunit (CoxS/CutS family)
MTAAANPQTACDFEAVRLLHSGSDHNGCGVRREGHAGSPEQTREYMSGNICRCRAYVGIVAAIKDVAVKTRRTET